MTKIYLMIEHGFATFMFLTTIIFLSIVAILIQYLQFDDGLDRLPYSQQWITILIVIWPFFFLERLLNIIICRRTGLKRYFSLFAIGILPPLRLVTQGCQHQGYIWLFGWRAIDHSLYLQLEKNFLFPILFISLFMIPFWITEIFFPKKIYHYDVLYHLINCGNALIWEVFVVEFIIMISISKKPWHYIIKHWLELFIIILPMFALARFILIPAFKMTSLLRLLKIQKMLNIYRARSVLNRTIRILIIINVIKIWYQRHNPKKYLKILKKQLKEKEEDIVKLKEQIQEIEQLIKENQEHKKSY